MGSKPDWRSIGLQMTAAEQAADEVARRQCAAAIEGWNERLRISEDPEPSPSIGVALTGGYRWLSFYCPGCRQVFDLDLASIDRHPRASIVSLITSLVCRSNCRGRSPLPQLLGLARFKPEPKRRSTLG